MSKHVRVLSEEEAKEKKLVEKVGKAMLLTDDEFLKRRPYVDHLLPKVKRGK